MAAFSYLLGLSNENLKTNVYSIEDSLVHPIRISSVPSCFVYPFFRLKLLKLSLHFVKPLHDVIRHICHEQLYAGTGTGTGTDT